MDNESVCEYIQQYIETINREINLKIQPNVKPAVFQRYPLYCNCIDKSFYYSDMFSILNEDQQKYCIIFAYSVILDANLSSRTQAAKQNGTINLVVDPNKICYVLCKLMRVTCCEYDEMLIGFYQMKRKYYSYPDPNSYFFRPGDIIKCTIFHYLVLDIYPEGGEIMVKIRSLHDHGNLNSIIIRPEFEMISSYKIVKPVEFQGK